MALSRLDMGGSARAVGRAVRRSDQRAQPRELRYYDRTTGSFIAMELSVRPRALHSALQRDPRELATIASRFHMRDSVLRELTVVARSVASMPAPERRSAPPGPLRGRVPDARIFATEAFAVGHAGTQVKRWLARFGARAIAERGAWTLYLAPPDGDPTIKAFELADEALRLGALNAHPNFIRLIQRPSTATSTQQRLWNHAVIGVADAHQLRNGRGRRAIRVAILDEGVDDRHPALSAAVVASRDFIDGASSAMPSGDDAHGTACAGIVASRDRSTPGIAPNVSLVAARIAKDDGAGHWVMDDFQTADAIEWCWRVARADVLSCSWKLGSPVDVIADAFSDTRTRGRKGKGAVVVIAAGNDEGPIQFPGTLSGPLVIGASNANDERKTRTTSDGEPHWGSSHGPTLGLLAPGIGIATTDISGSRGYTRGDFHDSFNGTSSAAPHVAAAAAILLSIAPELTEVEVKRSILRTARRFPMQKRWTATEGHGRLDLRRAALLVSRSPTTKKTRKPKKHAVLARAKPRGRKRVRGRPSSSKLG